MKAQWGHSTTLKNHHQNGIPGARNTEKNTQESLCLNAGCQTEAMCAIQPKWILCRANFSQRGWMIPSSVCLWTQEFRTTSFRKVCLQSIQTDTDNNLILGVLFSTLGPFWCPASRAGPRLHIFLGCQRCVLTKHNFFLKQNKTRFETQQS